MFAHLNPQSADFGDICALSSPSLHQLTMQSSLFEPGHPVSVVIYVSRASYARVQATVGVGTVLIRYFGIAYTRGGGVVFPHFYATRIHPKSFPAKTATLLRAALRALPRVFVVCVSSFSG